MTSVGETYDGSVPLDRLKYLQHALVHGFQPNYNPERVDGDDRQDHREKNAEFNPPVRDNHQRDNNQHDNDGSQLPSTVPESIDTFRTSRTSPPPKNRLRLSSHDSAPANIKATLRSPLSHDPAGGKMKAASSHGGDTQPSQTQEMPSQVYRESMIVEVSREETRTRTPEAHTFESDISKAYDTQDDDTVDIGYDGVSGQIDLLKDYRDSSPVKETQDYDDLLQSQTGDSPQTQFAVPAKPVMPETPATAREGSGEDELVTSVTTAKSDHLLSMFGGNQAALLSNSQLFAQTQARSSPPPDALRSDPVVSRPSPNINQSSLSPPTGFSSSPILTRQTQTALQPWVPGEPRPHYTTMKESQEQREARLKAEDERRRAEEGDDGEDDTQDSFFWELERRRAREEATEQARRKMLQVTAPARPGSRSTSYRKQKAAIDLRTPATAKKLAEFELTDDETEEEPEEEEADGTIEDVDDLPQSPIHEDEDIEGSEAQNYDDQYDEFNETITRSQVDYRGDDLDDNSIAEFHLTDASDTDKKEKIGLQDGSRVEVHSDLVGGLEGSMIADSQPGEAEGSARHTQSQRHQQSSMASFVPGSQYIGQTSEAQAVMASSQRSQRRSQSRIAASQTHGNAADRAANKITSSPPALATDSMVPEESLEQSLARREILRQFQARPDDSPSRDVGDRSSQREIPESDVLDAEWNRPHSRQSNPSRLNETQEMNTAARFSTARTHVSGSARSPAKSMIMESPAMLLQTQSQHSRLSEPTPRKAAGVKHFSQMNNSKPVSLSFENADADVDFVMNEVMTKDDKIVLAMADTPRRPQAKRRRINSDTFSREPSSKAKIALTPPSSDVQSTAESEQMQTAVEPNQKQAKLKGDLAHQSAAPDALGDDPNEDTEVSVGENALVTELEELPSSSKSQRMREKAGSDTVSQLIAAARSQKRSQQVHYGRNCRQKLHKIKKSLSKSSRVERATSAEVNKTSGSKETADLQEAAVETGLVNEVAGATSVQADDAASAQVEDSADDSSLVAPNRIWAFFPGTSITLFPATWLSTSPDGKSYEVRYDDGGQTNVHHHMVKHLDIRVGDIVSVNIPGMKQGTWRIVGFGPVAETEKERALGTDIYGHVRVKVQANSKRNGAPADAPALGSQSEGQVQEVQVTDLKLTQSLSSRINDRHFVPRAPLKAANLGRAGTPSTRSIGTPSTDTSMSRSRRAAAPNAATKIKSGRSSYLRRQSSALVTPTSTGIFSGMAFAISYVDNEPEKSGIADKIKRNGGLILIHGFEDLFELPAVDEISPNKRGGMEKSCIEDDQETFYGMKLKAEYMNLGFVALISNRHSRTTKYMQALALGIPTLSGRWVVHSLDSSKNESVSTGLPWDKYLLPAGESCFLGGAIRSRTLTPYAVSSARFDKTLTTRPSILDGGSVLIVASGEGEVWDRRKAFVFLTLALGADEVRRVRNLDEAKLVMAQEDADAELTRWVYVVGDIDEAFSALFGKSVPSGKRRKRASEAVGSGGIDELKMSATQGKVKLVNDEFVVQSLILGALAD